MIWIVVVSAQTKWGNDDYVIRERLLVLLVHEPRERMNIMWLKIRSTASAWAKKDDDGYVTKVRWPGSYPYVYGIVEGPCLMLSSGKWVSLDNLIWLNNDDEDSAS